MSVGTQTFGAGASGLVILLAFGCSSGDEPGRRTSDPGDTFDNPAEPLDPDPSGAGAPAIQSGGGAGSAPGVPAGTPVLAGTSGDDCGGGLEVIVRDFTEDHPDFEAFLGDGLKGLVEMDLGANSKPVYAHAGRTAHSAGPDAFEQWYRDVDGVNMRLSTTIAFTEASPGVFVYDSDAFFPLDGRGFGNGPDTSHNYLFTTEAHTRFTYKGGETFTFRGDDDLWVFVNGKLAVDLGGVHPVQQATLDFDAMASTLGLSAGETYPMDIFHAERHTVESNFRIETSVDLSCIENVSVD